MKIGIVTFEFPGLTKNGGIGTAYGRMAKLLSKQGHQVSIYFLDLEKEVPHGVLTRLQKNNPKLSFQVIQVSKEIESAHSWALARSVEIYQKVKNEKLDVLHFHDCMGIGWSSLKAKQAGLAFSDTEIVLGLHGPNFWVHDAHGYMSSNPHEYLQNKMERECVEMADHVVSPSQYMIDYLKSWEWIFPKGTQVIPNVNELGSNWQHSSLIEHHQINRLIFFGRLESRKGVFLFLEALQHLREKKWAWCLGVQKVLPVIFLGKDCETPEGEKISSLIAQKMKTMKDTYSFEILDGYSSQDCQKYFQRHADSLICLPSLADNSPYSVVEAIEQNLNFLTTDSGGQIELIHPDHQFDHVSPSHAYAFSEKIVHKMTQSYCLARPSQQLQAANEKWLQYHLDLKKKKSKIKKNGKPSLAVVVMARDGGMNLEKTLLSLARQKIKSHEVHVFNWQDQPRVTPLVFESLQIRFKHEGFRFYHALGLSHDKVYEMVISKIKSRYVLLLRDGDQLGKTALSEVLQTVSSHPGKTAFAFGMSIQNYQFHPHPIELNHALFFDDLIKYPMVFDRHSFQNEKITYSKECLGFNCGVHLKMSVKGESLVPVPTVLVDNPRREPYYPYWKATAQEVRWRLRQVAESIPKSFHRNLELAGSLVLRQD